MSQQITIGPPDLRTVDRKVLAVARFLYKNPLVKQRPAFMNGQRIDMFRFKRAVRALESPEYAKAQAKNPLYLPEFTSREMCIEFLKQLPFQRMAFQVTKLETQEALSKGLKPQSGVPCVLISPQQSFGDDNYFVWFYNPVPLKTYLYGALALVAILAVVLFPLWPLKMRQGAWYVSMAAIVFLAFLMVLSVVRLVLFIGTYFTVKPGIWLFPNLYEDLGFFESFRPLWAWHGQRTLPKKPKKKHAKKHKPSATNDAAQNLLSQLSGGAPAAGGNGADGNGGLAALAGVGGTGMLQTLIQTAVVSSKLKTQQRIQELVKKEGPKSNEELQSLQQQYFNEEMSKAQSNLQSLATKVQEHTQNRAATTPQT